MTFTESQRQKAGALIVDREVLCLASDIVDDLLIANAEFRGIGDAGIGPEDIENAYREVCPDCGEDVEEWEAEEAYREHCCSAGCGWTGDDPESEPQEIYEWWLVSDWLADKLAERGHPVCRNYALGLWGRCTTGQAIALDHGIQEIALSLDWVKREIAPQDPTQ